jgi:hypothetical protein
LGELDSDIVKVKVCGILDVEIDVTGVASIAAIPALSPLATHATLAAGAGGQVSVPVSSVLRFPPLASNAAFLPTGTVAATYGDVEKPVNEGSNMDSDLRRRMAAV